MSEFLCFKECTNAHGDDFNYFNRERTLALIEFYKTYRKKVGSGDIKNMKKLWEVIAREMSNLFKITINPSKCENKIKVLERNYKKTVDNNNKTGRGRKTFDYQKQFDEIYEKKANVRPSILLSSDTVIVPSKSIQDSCPGSEQLNVNYGIQSENRLDEAEVLIEVVEAMETEVHTPQKENIAKDNKGIKRRRQNSVPYVKRNEILKEIKDDLKLYYSQKLEIERQKLEISKKKLEDRQKRTEMLENQIEAGRSLQ